MNCCVLRMDVVLLVSLLCPQAHGVMNVIDAVKLGYLSRAVTLLARGEDVHAIDTIGWTALHSAAHMGQTELIKLLLDYNATLDSPEPNYGKTALHLAAYNGHEAAVATLLDAGANLEATDINGQTPLHLATWKGRTRVILQLLSHGAQVDAQDRRGSTPIFLATIKNMEEAVEELLPFCPDLRLPDSQGRTVSQYARDANLTILTILEDHASHPCNTHKPQRQAKRLVITEKGRSCPRGERHYPGDDRWSSSWWLRETPAGQALPIPCPPGANGTATWTCRPDATWERTPILSQCKAVIFSGWREALDDGDNVTAAQILMSMSSSLQDVTLAPGDLLTLVHILATLQDKHNQDLHNLTTLSGAYNLARVFMEGMMVAVNTMFSVPGLWWGLAPEQRATTSSLLQTSLTSAAVSLAYLQKAPTKTFTQQKLQVKVIQQPTAYFMKESGRSYTHPHFNLTTITLPHHFYDGYLQPLTTVKVVFFSFTDLHCTSNTLPCDPKQVKAERDLPAKGQVNSAIIGATVGDKTWHAALGEVVEVQLEHVYSGDTFALGVPTCVWWDEVSSSWATHGCRLAHTSANYSVCHCDHLTNLALITDVNDVIDTTSVLFYVMKCVSKVGCVVAVVSLALCVMCFVGFREVRGRASSVVHANMSLCLLGTELLVLGGLDAIHRPVACTVVAAFLHYLFLATFTWSAIEALHLYLSFVKVWKAGMGLVKYYLCVGYLVPLVYVSITLALTHTVGYGAPTACWLAPRGLIWTFAAPLAVILLVNVSALVMTMRAAWWGEDPEHTHHCHRGSGDNTLRGSGDTTRRGSGDTARRGSGDTAPRGSGNTTRRGSRDTTLCERLSVDTSHLERPPGDTDHLQNLSGDTNCLEKMQGNTNYLEKSSRDTDHSEKQPGDTDWFEKQPEDTKQLENQQRDTDWIGMQPGGNGGLEKQPEDTDWFEKQPGDTNQLDKKPGDTNQLEKLPGDTNQVEKQPEDINWLEKQVGYNSWLQRQAKCNRRKGRRLGYTSWLKKLPGYINQLEKQAENTNQLEKQSGDTTQFDKKTGDTKQLERQPGNEKERGDTGGSDKCSVNTRLHETQPGNTEKLEKSWDGSGSKGAGENKHQEEEAVEPLGRAGVGRRLFSSLTVLLLLCLTWLSGFLYYIHGTLAMAVVFTLVNSVLGVAIFLLHVVKNEYIMHEVREVLK
ncbi:uncharacterized protein [Cherax quadricarinatus]